MRKIYIPESEESELSEEYPAINDKAMVSFSFNNLFSFTSEIFLIFVTQLFITSYNNHTSL